jgi:hypothetical protein
MTIRPWNVGTHRWIVNRQVRAADARRLSPMRLAAAVGCNTFIAGVFLAGL